MVASYRTILDQLRLAFPQPVSDRVHDSYMVHSILRALDQVDELKSDLPILGETKPLDYLSARKSHIPEMPSTVERVTRELVGYLEGMTIFGHPRFQQNVVGPTSISSLIAVLLSSMYNPNLSWDEYSRLVSLAEVEATGMMANMVGYDSDQAGGLFTFGGTGTVLYGVKIGLEKACPGAMQSGIREDAYLFASDTSHYCRSSVAGWLGLGANNVVTIPSNEQNEIEITVLAQKAREILRSGKKIACFIASMGTTDAFGLDDLEAIVKLRDELVEEFSLPYRPHVHADAVIGWAWSVFNDYDVEENPMGFRRRTLRALAGATRRIRHLHLADSIGVDFHKTGFTPYISSLFLLRNQEDFLLLGRDLKTMPYLFQFGDYHPGTFTLETSRGGTGILSALANLKMFGWKGRQAIMGHLVEMTQLLREHLDGHESTTTLNRHNFGTVTIFRVYPKNVDTFEIAE
ncbi:MAG: pyridoxal phosphate-dependent decarboxylase family protein [Gemmataceae bacterium]